MNETVVELKRVTKVYGTVKAVDAVSLDIRRGEFFALLGPSGCGKTTTLRLIAGLEQLEPDGGEILLLGEPMHHRPAWERPVGMVFQNYALFPHLDVARNIAFGLEERRRPKEEITARVHRALELVRLDPAAFAARRPSELSGGQRQRVALARALVLEPRILLLDEPLGALDLQLRKAMQLELKALNRTLGITFVLVTHDQEEALAMSDRIAVMDHAKIAQVGTPADIYERPRTAFVAGFIGQCNLLARTSGGARVAIRPERIAVLPATDAPVAGESARGIVRELIYRGGTTHVVVQLDDGTEATAAIANTGRAAAWAPGDAVVIAWKLADASEVGE